MQQALVITVVEGVGVAAGVVAAGGQQVFDQVVVFDAEGDVDLAVAVGAEAVDQVLLELPLVAEAGVLVADGDVLGLVAVEVGRVELVELVGAAPAGDGGAEVEAEDRAGVREPAGHLAQEGLRRLQQRGRQRLAVQVEPAADQPPRQVDQAGELPARGQTQRVGARRLVERHLPEHVVARALQPSARQRAQVPPTCGCLPVEVQNPRRDVTALAPTQHLVVQLLDGTGGLVACPD